MNENKKYKKEHNCFKITPKMNYFARLTREMNVKYEGDNTPFLTREETEQMTVMFHGLMIDIINDCHFSGKYQHKILYK